MATIDKARMAALLRNAAKSRKQHGTGIPDVRQIDDTPVVRADTLVGVAFRILEVENIGATPVDENATILRVEIINTGKVVKMWAGAGIKRQLAAQAFDDSVFDPESDEQPAMTLVQEERENKKLRRTYLVTYMTFYDPEYSTLPQNGAATNRARVANTKHESMPAPDEIMSEEEEDTEEEEIEEEDTEEEEEIEPVKPVKSSKLVKNSRPVAPVKNSKTVPSKTVPSKTVPSKTVPSKSRTPGSYTDFGTGEFRRRRPPTAVAEYIAAGNDVFFSRKTGKYYQTDKKTVIS